MSGFEELRKNSAGNTTKKRQGPQRASWWRRAGIHGEEVVIAFQSVQNTQRMLAMCESPFLVGLARVL